MNKTGKWEATILNVGIAGGAVVFLFATWWLTWRFANSQFFPSPISVLSTAASLVLSGEFWTHFIATMRRIAIGFSLSFLAAAVIAVAMKRGGWLRRFILVQVTVGLTIPSLAWSVTGVMLFGLHDTAAIFTILFATLPVLITAIDQGLRALDGDLLEMGRIYRLGESQVLLAIVLPQLFPHLFGAVRYGFSLAWKTVIITEMLGLTSGLGYQISYYFGLLSLKHVLAWTLAFTSAMLVVEYGILQRLETYLFRWRPQDNAL